MRRIMIVEDDTENNQMLKEYLEDHGLHVRRLIPAERRSCWKLLF